MSSSTSASGRRDSRFLLVPAATFLVGLLLGAVLVWVGFGAGDGDGDGQVAGDVAASPQATGPTAEPTSTDVTVTIPAECVEAAELAQEVLDLARQAAAAIGELDAQRLQALVDEMEDLEPRINESTGDCQQLTGS